MTRLSNSVGILGTGAYVPEKILTNKDFEQMVETSDEWITTRTGIKERRIAHSSEAASDLALQAALKALETAGVRPEELDLIIVATVTPDMAFPATACLLQAKLKAPQAAAFDVSAGCSGFIYGLEVGRRMVQGGYSRVLVVGADVLSRVTDYEDRSTCVLFGDGAGAAVLGPVDEGYGIIATELGADGSGGEYLQLPAGGSKHPATNETIKERQHYIKMAGNDVFKFAVRVMGDSTNRVLEKAQVDADKIAWFIPHQANTRIIQSAATRAGIPEDRIYVNVDKYGNTSAASIGIALDEVFRNQQVLRDDYLLLVGFGAGLTWGSAVIKCQGGCTNE